MSLIEPLPLEWSQTVIRTLHRNNPNEIRWTFRAKQDWQQFGQRHDAINLLIQTLSQPCILGERIVGMEPLPAPPKGAGNQTVYAFLCRNPLGGLKPLYAKIGLFDNQITIDLFSIHIDLKGDLLKEIARYQKQK